jgi:hypothetical protein
MEHGKWGRIVRWGEADAAAQLIQESMDRAVAQDWKPFWNVLI